MSDGTLSIAALAVALVALIVALGQLFGQYLATADGYRRCQPSVMGYWAKYTRLRWRWSQFRFETLFTTPDILFSAANGTDDRRVAASSEVSRYYHDDSKPFTYGCHNYPELFQRQYNMEATNEAVNWLSLLDSLARQSKGAMPKSLLESQVLMLHQMSSIGEQSSGFIRPLVPAVVLRERSWDFMPPELIRPVATTDVHGIAIMAYRLGMTWVDFRPEENTMRAEGAGQVLNSTYVRSVGMIMQYMKFNDFESYVSQNSRYNPTAAAEALNFGILVFGMFKIGTIDEILNSMNQIGCGDKAKKKARDTYNVGKKPFGFSDIIPLLSPMMHCKGHTIIRLPVPTDHCDGLTSHKEGFFVFKERLNKYISSCRGTISPQVLWVQRTYTYLQTHFLEWEDENLANTQGNDRHEKFLDAVHDYYDQTTTWFGVHIGHQQDFHYLELVAVHISHAVYFWGESTKNIREKKARYDPSWMRDWVAEGSHLYWDYLPSITKTMMGNYPEINEELVHEAWITMMFRAFCWWRCHWMDLSETKENSGVTKMRLPSRHYQKKFERRRESSSMEENHLCSDSAD